MDWLFNPLPKAGMDWVFGVVPTAESLKTYKYRSPNLSLFERLFLDDFWGWLPGHVYPAWLAPNAITCAGLGAIAGMTALVLRKSPDLAGAAPRWVYGVCGASVWLYQTLDGSDGKQARATKSGSALGEVMDHGVDALATVLITVSSMDMAAFGASSWCTWTPVLTSCAGFYLSNMVLIHKGRQDFQEVDIQEMLCGIQFAFGVGAWRGAGFFRRALPLGLTPRWLFVVAGSGGSVANCAMYVASVAKTDKPAHLRPQFLALGAFLGAAAVNVATLGGSSVAPFVLAATAAFGDVSRRLLHQRVGVPPGAWLTAPTVLLLALPAAPERARWRVALAAAGLAFVGAARSARAMADALGVDVFTTRRRPPPPPASPEAWRTKKR